MTAKFPVTKYTISESDVLKPERALRTDPFFPISIVKRTNGRLEDIFGEYNDYELGITFECPQGYYMEILGTDNLLNAGYEMTHTKIVRNESEGITKKDTIVKLKKFKDLENLPLPFHGGLFGVLRSKNYSLLHSTSNKINAPENIPKNTNVPTFLNNPNNYNNNSNQKSSYFY